MSRPWPPRPHMPRSGPGPESDGFLTVGPWACGAVAYLWVAYSRTDSALAVWYVVGSVAVPCFLMSFLDGFLGKLWGRNDNNGAPPTKPDVTSKNGSDHDA